MSFQNDEKKEDERFRSLTIKHTHSHIHHVPPRRQVARKPKPKRRQGAGQLRNSGDGADADAAVVVTSKLAPATVDTTGFAPEKKIVSAASTPYSSDEISSVVVVVVVTP